ncbi:CoA transferase [Allobranchiibius sp. GilTou38]|uniref:CaiB/BaiF CoA transferase family protein n=1 Tax=Allobranchiibius sp. GilTou38 TaxID=2815210 RepID=UPI001AA1A8F9|nr:CoA transferase [Allobranchiibius sp. GilTou38]MBO1767261.1 CoA transferase [Allobranchiibius sp. GilTou38]
MTGALDGLLIADFGRVLAGPYATMLLADLGAEVVKIERPGSGDDTRQWGPPFDADGVATYFQAVNRNKRSLALDLRDESDRAQAAALVSRADVVVENLLPGGMDRLGLGYDDVRATNPGVVYCSVTGFGRDSSLPGYDLVVQAVGGLMSMTGPRPGEPTRAGVAVVDVVTGLHAAVGILAALRHRDRTGEGQRVEVDLMSCLLSSLVNQSSGYLLAGAVPQAMGNRHPSLVPYEVFQARDKPIVIACGNDRQFRSLAEVLGQSDLADNERYATNPQRVAHREELVPVVNDLLAAADAQDWYERMSAVGVPAGPVNDLAEAFEYADRLGLSAVVDCAGGRQVANPIGLSATPATYRSAPPALGG